MINEKMKWPSNKKQYDFNYLRVFGYCNQQGCPKHSHCFRYQERVGKNNISWVPRPDSYSTCKFFVPAICHYCSGRGYFDDWYKIQKKQIRTTCIICGGKGELTGD